ncbi:MAG: M28 family peptidase [Myxococcales bacterium]|nr:M28 family peptidase [Myxococcales bacterium]
MAPKKNAAKAVRKPVKVARPAKKTPAKKVQTPAKTKKTPPKAVKSPAAKSSVVQSKPAAAKPPRPVVIAEPPTVKVERTAESPINRANEQIYVQKLIERIVAECPERRPTSEDERRAHQIMQAEFERLGLATTEESFKFNENLYANMALHFGLGTLGTMVSALLPLVGLALHAGVGTSYLHDSTRKGYYLRRLFPWKKSQNLLATIPAKGEPALRIVLMGHADAAFTGLLFNPKIVEWFSGDLPPRLQFLKRSMEVATKAQFALAGFDLLRVFLGPLTWPLLPIEAAISVPGLIAFLLNVEVVLRNQVVPGANDNLSGTVALPILAGRLASRKPENVELVFAVTGCEEASLGGADALAKAKDGQWDKNKTVVIGLDGLTNGELRFTASEGEVVSEPIAPWLRAVLERTARIESRFHEVQAFEIPVGGTDSYAFMRRGFDAASLVCVDPQVGSPLHYHTVNDTPQNLDWEKLMFSIDFTEALVLEIIRERLR